MINNIIDQIELLTNWENEIEWDKKIWYSDLLVQNTSILYDTYLNSSDDNQDDDELVELNLAPYVNTNYQVDPYWNAINDIVSEIIEKTIKIKELMIGKRISFISDHKGIKM